MSSDGIAHAMSLRAKIVDWSCENAIADGSHGAVVTQ
jgi:hypothetical protein